MNSNLSRYVEDFTNSNKISTGNEHPLNYPVYFITGGNLDYANGDVDIPLSEVEMIDVELSSSDEEVSLSEYDLIQISEHGIESVNVTVENTDNLIMESNDVSKEKAMTLEDVSNETKNTNALEKPVVGKKKSEVFDELIAQWKPDLECVVCRSLCSTFTLLQLHFRINHPVLDFHVECCGYKYKRRRDMETHLRVRHGNKVSRKKSKVKEDKELQTEEVEAFIKNFIPTMKCAVCGYARHNFSSLRNHFLKQHPTDEAHIICCRRKLTELYSIYDHIRVHLNENSFKCELCGKFHITKLSLDHHMLNQHHISVCTSSSEYNNSIIVGKNKTICRTRFSDLEEFIAIWRPDLKCELCSESFINYGILEKHFRFQHKQTMAYILCCERKLRTRHAVEEHIHLHADPRGFQCHSCDKHYSSRPSLYNHMCQQHPIPADWDVALESEAMKNEEEKLTSSTKIDKLVTQSKININCGECYAKFSTITILRRHFYKHHPNKEWYFLCCQQKWKSFTTINSHLRVHLNQCDLSQHVDTIVPDRRPERLIQKIPQKPKENLDEYDKLIAQWKANLKCMICHTYYRKYSLLRKHFRNAHPSTDCYIVCCQRRLSNLSIIAQHIQYHRNQTVFVCGGCGLRAKSKLVLTSHTCCTNFNTKSGSVYRKERARNN